MADVIIGDLENNGIRLTNSAYRTIYDEYKQLWEAGEQIEMHRFINHADPTVATAIVDLLTYDDNYTASKLWQKHDIIVESEQDRLPVAVPRVVILYKSKGDRDDHRRTTAQAVQRRAFGRGARYGDTPNFGTEPGAYSDRQKAFQADSLAQTDPKKTTRLQPIYYHTTPTYRAVSDWKSANSRSLFPTRYNRIQQHPVPH